MVSTLPNITNIRAIVVICSPKNCSAFLNAYAILPSLDIGGEDVWQFLQFFEVGDSNAEVPGPARDVIAGIQRKKIFARVMDF